MWARLEGDMWSDPQVATLSLQAVGLYTLLTCYSAAHLTDGVITDAVIARHFNHVDSDCEDLLAELCESGLLHRTRTDGGGCQCTATAVGIAFGGGYYLHEHQQRNPSQPRDRRVGGGWAMMADFDHHPDAGDIASALTATAAAQTDREARAVEAAVQATHDALVSAGCPHHLVHLMMGSPSWQLVVKTSVTAALRTDQESTSSLTLDERATEYFARRGHTPNTDDLQGHARWLAQAEYVLGECEELVDAVEGNDRDEDRGAVFDEIADVVVSTTVLARYLGTTVEACIERKTTKDTGRG